MGEAVKGELYIPGQFYRVPCVEAEWCGRKGIWVVMGPEHDDKEVIGFSDKHYHAHPQFAPAWAVEWEHLRPYRSLPKVVSHVIHAVEETSWGYKPVPVVNLGLRLRKCRRPMPDYPVIPPWYVELAKTVEGKPLNLERPVCPHRGAKLDCVPVRNGCITCPLHGLIFDAKTGSVKTSL